MSKNITLSQFNYGNWYLLEQTFVVNDMDYEWLIIESQESESPGNCRTYLLIDNVSLQRSCELSCDQSSGAINTPTYISNPGQWWGITGLDNVTEAVIDIYTLIGQTFVRRIYKNATNGIKDAIYWDGRDENNNPVAVAPYIARIYLKNDCDEKEFGQVISHQNINHNLAPPPNKNYYTGPVKIPRPCCAGIQDYYLSNVVLEAPYEWDYVIYGNLYLNNVTIQPGAIVNFQAGSDIYSGFTEITALPGVESFQYNTPCTPQRIYNDDGEEINWQENEQERLVNTEIYNWPQINNEVIIYPNPSNGIFNIVCSNNELFILEVVSLQGNKILDTEFQGNHTLNLSHLNKGVYLVKIHGNDIMHTQKIIIQ